jgi:hypothetical protein
LARHALSQMDVSIRQAHTMVLVTPRRTGRGSGAHQCGRPAAASLPPAISGVALQAAANGVSFVLAGGLKIIYDVILWLAFRRVPLPEEHALDEIHVSRPR